MTDTWVCPTCGTSWPKATTVDAYRGRQTAQLIHPGRECELEAAS